MHGLCTSGEAQRLPLSTRWFVRSFSGWSSQVTFKDNVSLHAVLYRDTAEAIRWEMAKAVAPEDWPRQTGLLARLAMYETRAEKAGLITRVLTANAPNQDDLANISEVLGLQYYHQVQGGPPGSDQRQRRPPNDAAYADRCRRCLAAYEQAASILPDEWQFPYFIGKMQSKLGAPPEQVRHFSQHDLGFASVAWQHCMPSCSESLEAFVDACLRAPV